ncbi:VOC family protein [Paenibacillus sp. HN-1]|uniref:VOC family protein n=1 Tax=Paenibacillus sp. CGMCC 1.18879 TaxID=2834466 RepID=UPI001CA7BF23|nr:VOC family protein [Paenibacillus sp. CGMCC 1.18879]MBY9080393.1 VOC family protein [Paenibacillus sp. CGMCC 1.18879]MBY9083973.1 VOC family protein [Paenibacillus sinensis]
MLKCSHILCRVDNVADVVRNYEALGFTVQWGSAPKRALNAFIWFEEGPFIELFQIPKSLTFFIPPLGLLFGRAAGRRWAYWAKVQEGWCDVALEPDDSATVHGDAGSVGRVEQLAAIRQSLRRSGLKTSRLIHGSRTRPDNVKVSYSLFATEPLGLPFVVSLYDPPQRPEKIRHSNGATGIEWVRMGIAAEHRSAMRLLVEEDRWLRLVNAPQTKVLEVGLAGLQASLEGSRLHGAVFKPAVQVTGV